MKKLFLVLIPVFMPFMISLAQQPEGSDFYIPPKESFIVINELMASNLTTVQDNYGEFDDWIELYNNTDADFDLSGYFLSDNPANLDKWEMPEGTIIPASGYAIFWADEDSAQGPNHCNFKLSASGEVLMLLDPQLLIVDSVHFGTQLTDMGYARVPNGVGSFIIKVPTFNASNGNLSISEEPLFSNLKIYPNPADDLLIVRFIRPAAFTRVEISDACGKIIYRKDIMDETSINVSSWPAGCYLLHSGAVRQKIMIR